MRWATRCPTARVELTTIARAKVEVAYGRRDLGADRLQRIAQAYHRLRLAIISVIVGVACAASAGGVAARPLAGESGLRLERAAPAALRRRGPGPRSPAGSVRWSVALCSRRRGRPSRISTTVIPQSANGSVQNRRQRAVEERQQRDLEDAVVRDDDRPGLVRRDIAVAEDLRAPGHVVPARPWRGPEELPQRHADAEVNLGDRLAARRPGRRADRVARPPAAHPSARPLGAGQALPFALADLEQAGLGHERHGRGDGVLAAATIDRPRPMTVAVSAARRSGE